MSELKAVEKEWKWLPNPELIREPIVSKCDGCQKIFENHALPESEILVDVCVCYEKPDIKWNKYYREEETNDKTKKKKVYHYNPCPMATHIKHNPKVAEIRGRVKRK